MACRKLRFLRGTGRKVRANRCLPRNVDMTLDRSHIYTMLGSPIVIFLCFALKKNSLIKFLLAILGDLTGMKGEREGKVWSIPRLA